MTFYQLRTELADRTSIAKDDTPVASSVIWPGSALSAVAPWLVVTYLAYLEFGAASEGSAQAMETLFGEVIIRPAASWSDKVSVVYSAFGWTAWQLCGFGAFLLLCGAIIVHTSYVVLYSVRLFFSPFHVACPTSELDIFACCPQNAARLCGGDLPAPLPLREILRSAGVVAEGESARTATFRAQKRSQHQSVACAARWPHLASEAPVAADSRLYRVILVYVGDGAVRAAERAGDPQGGQLHARVCAWRPDVLVRFGLPLRPTVPLVELQD